ncbi:FMN-binding negative transcriptional regulator [Inhella proteolytica]|uniref:FMN-binding negative transcriptional regulator n=1 Tax=Inhella proteolytica TaxID=2795029 RepID=A0A931NG88_9BURK|nr:FMN-binding negative transcriptional regulator [Inhella proteolytica]MBH9576901.1 FMN-binding negative transcriptional regulator [Inhella proteolytica]
MYIPPHFAAPSDAACIELLRTHPLGTLVWQQADALEATPLPWLLRQHAGLQLAGHVARANPLLKALAAGPLPVLVIFQGPQGYISPNWYPSKAETERQVPTWNYSTVHAHGHLRAVDEAGWVRELLDELTRQHEAALPKPWRLEDAAPGFIEQLQRVIVGIELQVERLEGKFKLGQDEQARDQQGSAAMLRQRGAHALADAMQP